MGNGRGRIDYGDYREHVARDLFPDRFSVRKFGANNAVGTAAHEHIWGPGGTYSWLESARTVRVAAGGNVNDTIAGTGARKITVQGLDENWTLASEEIELAGASASAATTTTFIRLFRAFVSEVGAYGGTNAAAIAIQDTTDSTTRLRIETGLGQSSFAAYTVPAGYSAVIMAVSITVDALKSANVRFHIRANDTTFTTYYPDRVAFQLFGEVGFYNRTGQVFDVVPQYTDLWWSARGDAQETSVSVDFDMLLIQDP